MSGFRAEKAGSIGTRPRRDRRGARGRNPGWIAPPEVETFLEMLVADPKLVTNEMVEDVLKFKRLDGVDAALNRIATACFAGGQQSLQLTARLGELKVPVQVIWGEQDRIIPASHGAGLPASIKVTRLADAGHLAHMEKAGEVNALIKAFAANQARP